MFIYQDWERILFIFRIKCTPARSCQGNGSSNLGTGVRTLKKEPKLPLLLLRS